MGGSRWSAAGLIAAALTLASAAVGPVTTASAGTVAFSSDHCTDQDDYERRKPAPPPPGPRPPGASGESGSCRYALWLVEDDGANLRRITGDQPDGQDSSPSWSPDGLRLVFSRSQPDGSSGLWTVGFTGLGAHPVVPDHPGGRLDRYESEYGGLWSVDGRIVFTSNRRTDPAEFVPDRNVYSMRPDGSDVRALTTGPADETAVSIAPDGGIVLRRSANLTFPHQYSEEEQREIRRQADEGLFVMDAGGGATRPLIAGGLAPPLAYRAVFSQDGSHIALGIDDHSGRQVKNHTFTMTAQGGDLRRRTEAYEANAVWGAGGTLIYEGRSSDRPLYEDRRFGLFALDTSTPAARPRVISGPVEHAFQPAWHAGPGQRLLEKVKDVVAPLARLVDARTKHTIGTFRRGGRATVSASRAVRRDRVRYLAADAGGVRSVRVAVFRRGRRCRFLARRGTALRSCRRPVYRPAKRAVQWRRLVRRLRPGHWGFRFRTRDARGNVRSRRPLYVRIRR